MQVFGFTLNLLTLLAIVLSVGLVVDDAIVVVENVERHIREGQTPFEAALLGARELVGPDHRHDHHAGRGVRADRLPGRPHRRAVPRVRLHAGGRGVHLGRRGADAVADDVVAAAAAPSTSTAGSRAWSTGAFERVKRALRAHAGRRRCAIRPAVYVVWIVLVARWSCRMYMFSPGELAPHRGPGRRVRRDRRARQRDARAGHALHRAGRSQASSRRPSSTTASRSRFPSGGFGGMLVKPWDERKRSIFQIQQELFRQADDASRACARRCSCRRRCRARASSRSSS